MKRITTLTENSTYLTWALKGIGGIFGALLGYFGVIIIQNEELFAAIFGVVVFDFIIGLRKSIKLDHKGFSPSKAVTTLYQLGGYYGLVTVVIMVENVHKSVSWLTESIFIPILIITVMGTIKNMELIGMIKAKVVTAIFSNIERHKNDMYKDDENEQTPPPISNPENIEG